MKAKKTANSAGPGRSPGQGNSGKSKAVKNGSPVKGAKIAKTTPNFKPQVVFGNKNKGKAGGKTNIQTT